MAAASIDPRVLGASLIGDQLDGSRLRPAGYERLHGRTAEDAGAGRDLVSDVASKDTEQVLFHGFVERDVEVCLSLGEVLNVEEHPDTVVLSGDEQGHLDELRVCAEPI